MLKRTTSIAFLVVCGIYLGFSQNVKMKHFRASDGLPSNEVFHVMQDSTGYIWFSTDNGVSRYDGYEFENFDNTNGLAGSTILYSYQDYKGRIWFVSLGTKLSYYYQDSIYQYQWNDKLKESFRRSQVPIKRGLYVDTAEHVYISSRPAGIRKISPLGKITKWDSHNVPLQIYIHDFDEKALMSKYITSSDSLRIIKNGKISYSVNNLSSIKNKGLSLIRKIDSNHYIFSSGSNIFELKNQSLRHIHKLKKKEIIEMIITQKGDIWLGYKNHGIALFHDKKFDTPSAHYLEGNSVSTVMNDADHGTWYTTLKDGVFYKPPKNIKTISNTNRLTSNHINYSRIDKNGKLLLATSDRFINVIPNWQNGNLEGTQQILLNKNGPDNNTCILMQEDRVYFGTDQAQFMATNYKYDQIRKVEIVNYIKKDFQNPIEATSGVKEILKRPDNSLCFGNPTGYFLKHSLSDHGDTIYSKWIDYLRTSCMAYDTANECTWIGSLYGLYKHPKNTDSLAHINSKHSLLNQRIVDIETIGQNRLAIAFKGNGLLLYNVAKDSALLIEKRDGLSSNVVRDIMKDDKDLWVGTNNGISFIDLAHPKKQITQISKADGLASDETNEIHLHDSLVLVSTAEGLSYFNKNQLNFKYKPTSVIIKAVNVSSENKNHSRENNIRIQYPHNSLRFKFTPLLYDNNRDLTFKYRVKGLNENWKYTQKNSVFFYYLPPGKYTFEIAVRNKSGIWSNTPSKVSFYIEPALWNKTWFIILIISAITLVVFSILYLLLRNYIIKTTARQDITRYQQQALSNQMNPHFLFNSLNSIHRFLLENDAIHASKFLSKFARLMRLFLNNSKANEINLSKEIESIKLYLELENLRMKDSFDYSVSVDDTIDTRRVMIPSMLIQPLVENSIIHGIRYLENQRGSISISFTQENNFMCITVEDNGVGRRKAAEIEQKNLHQSSGNSIVSKRIELLNQLYRSFISLKYIDLYEDNLGVGTRVIIDRFPIKKKYVEDTNHR